MATFLLWAIQNSQRGPARARSQRARARRGLCRSKKHRPEHMLTWQTNRSRLRAHFSSQAKMATFGLWAIQNSQRGRARARGGVCRPAQKQTPETMLTWKSNRTPLRANFSPQANMATFLLWAIQNSKRGRARARAQRGLRRPAQKQTPETMLTWKTNRSPLRVHFSFQANMATFLLWAIQNSQRGRARARGVVCVVQHRNRHQKLC